jgi:hypothetical protein
MAAAYHHSAVKIEILSIRILNLIPNPDLTPFFSSLIQLVIFDPTYPESLTIRRFVLLVNYVPNFFGGEVFFLLTTPLMGDP